MRFVRLVTTFLTRFCISAIFLAGGINKIINWHETEKTVANLLSDWQGYMADFESVQNGLAVLIPWTPLILMAGTLFELVGGLLILLGYKEKLGSGLLIIFLIPTTVLMHQFWFIETGDRELQTAMFLKNLAILGALFLVLLHGVQAKSAEKEGGDPFPSLKIG